MVNLKAKIIEKLNEALSVSVGEINTSHIDTLSSLLSNINHMLAIHNEPGKDTSTTPQAECGAHSRAGLALKKTPAGGSVSEANMNLYSFYLQEA